MVSQRHFIPKTLHANMFLVHQARDVMDRDILLLPTIPLRRTRPVFMINSGCSRQRPLASAKTKRNIVWSSRIGKRATCLPGRP